MSSQCSFVFVHFSSILFIHVSVHAHLEENNKNFVLTLEFVVKFHLLLFLFLVSFVNFRLYFVCQLFFFIFSLFLLFCLLKILSHFFAEIETELFLLFDVSKKNVDVIEFLFSNTQKKNTKKKKKIY